MLELLILFQIKHFVCDFPLQAFPYQYLNKATYGHLGGIIHAFIHFFASYLILLFFTNNIMAFSLAALDGIIHYHIDWAKMNINKHYGWKPDNSEKFWIALGFDQLLHQLTYMGLIWLLFSA